MDKAAAKIYIGNEIFVQSKANKNLTLHDR